MDRSFIALILTIREKYGEAALLAPSRLRSLLSDYAAGSHRGAIRIFLLALEEGFVARLRKQDNPSEAFLRTQASFFADSFGLTEKTGESIIWCWAEALGLSIAGWQVTSEHMPSSGTPQRPGASAEKTSQSQNMGQLCRTVAALQTYTNSIGMEFILIPAGSFLMGADKSFEDAYDNEAPIHRVSISKPFYMGKFEVTQAQWVAVMGSNPSTFTGRSNPVEQVSWDDAQAFIRRLNQQEGHTRYRLPTEAEWEYAARAGTESAYFFGDNATQIGRYTWYKDNSGGTTHPVGQKAPNPWGLHDMHGNVWEWVQDRYGKDYYHNSACTDPQGPSLSSSRVSRGGGWHYPASYCRSALRYDYSPDYRNYDIGFRLALSPEEQ